MKAESSTCMQYDVRSVALLFSKFLILVKYKAVEGKEGKIFPVCAMKAYGGAEVHLHAFLTLIPDSGKW